MEPEPVRGVALDAGCGARRVVADNPGPMTYHGTNSWLVPDGAGTIVIDPGPDQAAHRAAILGAAGRITAILITHRHADHAACALPLALASGAPVLGFGQDGAGQIGEGAVVGPLRALHMPGHASDHLCFVWRDGILFSGDHVMGWSTSVVPPPDGDMAAYCASLSRMIGAGHRLLLPGHGPPVPEPDRFVAGLLAHRRQREAAILRALQPGPCTIADLTARLYPNRDAALWRVAMMTVEAHLIKLQAAGRAIHDGAVWRRADATGSEPTE